MSITSDIRAYADTAKDSVSALAAKAGDTVNDLRAQAEKAVNLDAIKAAVEPYRTQAKGYTHTVTDRAEALVDAVKNDTRVAKLVSTAEFLTGAVVETVQEKVLKPVQSRTGVGAKPAAPPAPPAPPASPASPAPGVPSATAAKAATKPAPSPARKSPARKAAAKAPEA